MNQTYELTTTFGEVVLDFELTEDGNLNVGIYYDLDLSKEDEEKLKEEIQGQLNKFVSHLNEKLKEHMNDNVSE